MEKILSRLKDALKKSPETWVWGLAILALAVVCIIRIATL